MSLKNRDLQINRYYFYDYGADSIIICWSGMNQLHPSCNIDGSDFSSQSGYLQSNSHIVELREATEQEANVLRERMMVNGFNAPSFNSITYNVY